MSRTKLLAMSILTTTALLGAAATQAAPHGPQPQAADAPANPFLLQGSDPDEPGGDTDYDTDGSGSIQGQDSSRRSSVESQNRNEGDQTGEHERDQNGEHEGEDEDQD